MSQDERSGADALVQGVLQDECDELSALCDVGDGDVDADNFVALQLWRDRFRDLLSEARELLPVPMERVQRLDGRWQRLTWAEARVARKADREARLDQAVLAVEARRPVAAEPSLPKGVIRYAKIRAHLDLSVDLPELRPGEVIYRLTEPLPPDGHVYMPVQDELTQQQMRGSCRNLSRELIAVFWPGSPLPAAVDVHVVVLAPPLPPLPSSLDWRRL
ncbi:MAG: hypothetical protein RIR25_484 [Verrucomicrobiota bacterium]|jgi:hypothetical protein